MQHQEEDGISPANKQDDFITPKRAREIREEIEKTRGQNPPQELVTRSG
jgi:hypothetical protein